MVFSQQKSQKKKSKKYWHEKLGAQGKYNNGNCGGVAIVAVFKATLFVRLRLCCAAALSELYIS